MFEIHTFLQHHGMLVPLSNYMRDGGAIELIEGAIEMSVDNTSLLTRDDTDVMESMWDTLISGLPDIADGQAYLMPSLSPSIKTILFKPTIERERHTVTIEVALRSGKARKATVAYDEFMLTTVTQARAYYRHMARILSNEPDEQVYFDNMEQTLIAFQEAGYRPVPGLGLPSPARDVGAQESIPEVEVFRLPPREGEDPPDGIVSPTLEVRSFLWVRDTYVPVASYTGDALDLDHDYIEGALEIVAGERVLLPFTELAYMGDTWGGLVYSLQRIAAGQEGQSFLFGSPDNGPGALNYWPDAQRRWVTFETTVECETLYTAAIDYDAVIRTLTTEGRVFFERLKLASSEPDFLSMCDEVLDILSRFERSGYQPVEIKRRPALV